MGKLRLILRILFGKRYFMVHISNDRLDLKVRSRGLNIGDGELIAGLLLKNMEDSLTQPSVDEAKKIIQGK